VWTPTFNDAGVYHVTFSLTDGLVKVNQTSTITIVNVNRAPVLAPIGNVSVNANGTLIIQLNATDPDGDALTYKSNALIVLPSNSSLGNSTGLFTWHTKITDNGTYIVTFNVSDGTLYDTKTATIKVNHTASVNHPPVLAPVGNFSVFENKTLTIKLNATDTDGPATLNYSINTTLPSPYSFNTSSGKFVWTPTFKDAGIYHIIFGASDGITKVTTLSTITVINVDRSPSIISSCPMTGTIGTSVIYNLNATDPDNDPLSYLLVTHPAGMIINQTGRISWTPTTSGTFNALIAVVDPYGLTAWQSCTIVVAPKKHDR